MSSHGSSHLKERGKVLVDIFFFFFFLKEIYYSRHLPWGRARAVASYTCESMWLKIIRQLKGEVEWDDSSEGDM